MGILRSTGVPRAVSQADQPLRRLDLSYLLWCLSLLDQARAAVEPIDRQLLLLARSKGSAGFSLNDAVLALDPAVELAELRRVLDDLQQHELLLISNDAQGRVVYREP